MSVVVIDLDGKLVDGDQNPSIESKFHLGIYRVRPDVGAVFHAHPPYATSYAIANRELPLVTGPGRFVLKNVPLLGYAPSGSSELAEAVTAAFSDRTVVSVLLSGHGVVTVGADMYKAFSHLDWTEDAAQVGHLLASFRNNPSAV